MLKRTQILAYSKIRIPSLFLLVGLLTMNIGLFGQSEEWTTQTSKDGKIQIQSRISRLDYESGKEVQLAEYVVKTVSEVKIEDCVSVMMDASKHKEFMDYTEVSEFVRDLPDDEWLVYYYVDAPWPLPNSDCVARFNIQEDDSDKRISVESVAVPDMIEDRGVRRSEVNDQIYIFEELDNGKVEITMKGKFIPVVRIPNWLIKSWFPEGPEKIMNRFINLAENVY